MLRTLHGGLVAAHDVVLMSLGRHLHLLVHDVGWLVHGVHSQSHVHLLKHHARVLFSLLGDVWVGQCGLPELLSGACDEWGNEPCDLS